MNSEQTAVATQRNLSTSGSSVALWVLVALFLFGWRRFRVGKIPNGHMYHRNDLGYRKCEKVDDETYQIFLYVRFVYLREYDFGIVIGKYMFAAALRNHIAQPLLSKF